MTREAEPEERACELCGADASGSEWVALEVTRAMRTMDGDEDLAFVDANFCSQEHAARWLARPLPEPEALPEYVPSWRDRWVDLGLGAAFVVVIGLASVGLVAIARWAWGLA
ncbi:hypothetical protein [Demequina activiva]|nr:hypothetical protein [Demequina activiva]